MVDYILKPIAAIILQSKISIALHKRDEALAVKDHLGADGLSSSAYGPEETFRQLGEHVGLAAR